MIVALILSCSDREVRGKSVRSTDGNTYLVVEEPDGPACTTLYVDGQRWEHSLRTPGKISAGTHQIGCGDSATIGFEVQPGTTFHLDYWGP
jgi:hypothetical protein